MPHKGKGTPLWLHWDEEWFGWTWYFDQTARQSVSLFDRKTKRKETKYNDK